MTLKWATTNATAVRLDGVAVALSGSKTVTPTADHVYVLQADGSVPTVSASVAVTVTQPAPAPNPQPAPTPLGSLPVFTLSSGVGGLQPFAFGHVFRKGDVPAGKTVATALADWQCSPATYWPDGSLRRAIIAGRATFTAGVPLPIPMTVASPVPATALTEADLGALDVTVTLTNAAGSQTIALKDVIGTPQRVVCTGPVMSNWLYRKPVDGSAHLVLWFDVRVYKGGAVEVLPWIENGYLLVPTPTLDTRGYTVTVNGAVRYSNVALDVKHHTRLVLLDNTGLAFKPWSYWTVPDPQIVPRHDVRYLQDTGMVPNYGPTVLESTLAKLKRDYSPNCLGDVSSGMGSASHSGYVGTIPPWGASYITSNADPRAWEAVMMQGYSSGSWPMHYRDETTNEPLLHDKYPNIWLSGSPKGTPTPPAGTGGANGVPDTAHQPSLSYLPLLLSGRWFFIDAQLLWNSWSFMWSNYVYREGADFVQIFGQTRARGRMLRSIAQLLATLPAEHPSFSRLMNIWEKNTAAFRDRYITGARDNGTWVNSIGWMGCYSSHPGELSAYNIDGAIDNTNGYWWDAPWMQLNICIAVAHAWRLDLAQSTDSRAAHQAVRDFAYKLPVGLSGDGSVGTSSYRRFPHFTFPVGTDQTGLPPDKWTTDFGAAYAVIQQLGEQHDGPYKPLDDTTTILLYDAPVTAPEWCGHSAINYGMAALAMAVDDGIPGALEGWNRITSSSSWALAGTSTGYPSYPNWAYWPRSK